MAVLGPILLFCPDSLHGLTFYYSLSHISERNATVKSKATGHKYELIAC